MIWTQVEGEVTARNDAFKIKVIRHSLEKALYCMTVENWKDCVQILKIYK